MTSIHQHIVRQFYFRSSQAWLEGYSDAYTLWNSDSSWQEFTLRVAELWQQRTDPQKEGRDRVSPEIFAVGCLNTALRKNAEDPGAWLQPLSDSGPPDMKGIRSKNSSQQTPAEQAWYWLSYGLKSPRFDLLVKVWDGLTPAFRNLISGELPAEEERMPEQFNSPASIGWLEKTVRGCEPSDAVSVLSEYRDLTTGQAEALAGALIDQHEVWKSLDVFHSGTGDMVGAFVPDRLAELVCYHSPLSDTMLSRATELDVTWPMSIQVRPGQDLVELEAQMEMPGVEPGYFRDGFALEETSDRPDSPQPVIASGARTIKVGMRSLLVVLDIDLTHESASFLKLNGKRLCICAPPGIMDDPFFTRVDLRGGVKLMSPFQKVPKYEDEYDLPGDVFLLERPLISPYEGLREAGGCLGREERFGGAPNWEQYAEIPMSPKGGKPMTFLAQFDHALGGTLYAFLDFENLIAAVLVQNG